MNRFHNVQNKEYIDPFQPLPLEAIQGYMVNKQAGYDKAEEALNSMNEAFLGIKPGMFTKDQYYKDYVNKYNPEIEEMTNLILQDPNSAGRVASKVKGLQTKLANDPLAKAIQQDYDYTQALAGKVAGSTDDWVYRNNTPLDYDQMGNPIMPTPDLYGIAKDEDVVGTLAKEVGTLLKPNVVKNDSGTYTVSIYNPYTNSFDVEEKKTITEVKQLTREKIGRYITENYDRLNEKAEYNFIKEAERLGNRELVNDENWRRQYFNQMVEPVYELAYREKDVKNESKNITDALNKARGSNTTSSINTDKPSKPIVKSTVGVARGSINVYDPNDNSGVAKKIYTPENANTSIKNINISQKGLMKNLETIFLKNSNNEIPDNFQNTPEYFTQFIKDNFTFGDNNTFYSDQFPNLANNDDFKEAATQMINLQDLKVRTQAFKSNMEKILPKLNDNEKIELKNVTDKIDQINSDNILIPGPKFELTQEQIAKQKAEAMQNSSDKVKEYYKIWEEYSNKKDNQNYISLETGENTNLLKQTILNKMIDGSKSFKDAGTDIVLNDKQLKEIREKIPKDDEGNYDMSKITLGFTYDPKDGLIGILNTPEGAIDIEVNSKDFNIRDFAKYVSKDDFEIIQVYEENISKLYNNPGSEENINLYGFDFKAKLDPSKNKFIWTDVYGIQQSTTDASDMVNHYTQMKVFVDQQKQDVILAQAQGYNVEKNKIMNEYNGVLTKEAANRINALNQRQAAEAQKTLNESPSEYFKDKGLGKTQAPVQEKGKLGLFN